MIRRQPRYTLNDTSFPYTSPFRPHVAHAVEVEVARNRVLAGLDVAADRVAGAGCLAQLLGRHGAERIVERGLDRQLLRVVELLALGREELDAIVVIDRKSVV